MYKYELGYVFGDNEIHSHYSEIRTEDIDLENGLKPSEEAVICSKCQQKMKYEKSQTTFLIKCPKCDTITAVKPLQKLKCGACKIILCYPTGSKFVKCQCGVINEAP